MPPAHPAALQVASIVQDLLDEKQREVDELTRRLDALVVRVRRVPWSEEAERALLVFLERHFTPATTPGDPDQDVTDHIARIINLLKERHHGHEEGSPRHDR